MDIRNGRGVSQPMTSPTAFMTGARMFGKPKPNTEYPLVIRIEPEDYQKLLPLGEVERYTIAPGCEPWWTSLRIGKLVLVCCLDDEAWNQWQEFNAKLAQQPQINRKVVQSIYGEVFGVT